MNATYSGRLELTWTNKDKHLLAHDDVSYEWVSPADYRVSEVRLLRDAGTMVRNLIDAAEELRPGSGLLVQILAYGGLRWGEAVVLRRGRCDLLRSKLMIRESLSEVRGHLYFGPTKTHEDRVIVLPKFLRGAMAVHLAQYVPPEPDALVFTSPQGEPLRISNWRRRVWRPACEAAGMPEGLRIHDYADLRVMPTSVQRPLRVGVIAASGSA